MWINSSQLSHVFSKCTKPLQRTRALQFLPQYILKDPIFRNSLHRRGVILTVFICFELFVIIFGCFTLLLHNSSLRRLDSHCLSSHRKERSGAKPAEPKLGATLRRQFAGSCGKESRTDLGRIRARQKPGNTRLVVASFETDFSGSILNHFEGFVVIYIQDLIIKKGRRKN